MCVCVCVTMLVAIYIVLCTNSSPSGLLIICVKGIYELT